MPAIAEAYFHNMSLDEWFDLVQEQVHVGYSYDEDHPLSTYVPINQAQKELIKSYYFTYHTKLNSYLQFNEMINKLIEDLAKLPNQATFNERYPSFPYFLQAICNETHIFCAESEIRPGREYWPITSKQSEMIQDEYTKQSDKNPIYHREDLTNFIQLVNKHGDRSGAAVSDIW